MPDFIRADTDIKLGLLEGLVPHEAYNRMAFPAPIVGEVDGAILQDVASRVRPARAVTVMLRRAA
jgi:hypothetical protein